MTIFLIFLFLLIIIMIYKNINSKKLKKNNLFKFKTKFHSRESNIEKIFLREDEKTTSNPNINIRIEYYDNEEVIKRKSNIHRARLSKFKKSKLNDELIYMDDDQRIYKYIDGKRQYL